LYDIIGRIRRCRILSIQYNEYIKLMFNLRTTLE
jgi:hypothetical protein